ncbi:MAG: hypothetical protein E7261_02235 [Lachnospiraceae bacterium]|nr:hypothetical protein [Lachnospiraceae bacterium]
MKKWENPMVAELNINETADGLFPAMYEGIFGDCLCGNDDNHGPLTGHNDGKGDTPENKNS